MASKAAELEMEINEHRFVADAPHYLYIFLRPESQLQQTQDVSLTTPETDRLSAFRRF